MLLSAYQVSQTTDPDEMVDGVLARNPQFRNVSARRTPKWLYRHNRLMLGSARLGTSHVSDVRYEAREAEDVTIAFAMRGEERFSVRGETRRLGDLPGFYPSDPSTGVALDAEFLTLRLDRARLAAQLREAGVTTALNDILARRWLEPIPGAPALKHLLLNVAHHVDRFGPPSPAEARPLEDLLYASVVVGLTERGKAEREGADAQRFRKSMQFIDANLGGSIAVSSVADAAGMSLRGAQALFARHAGQTITQSILSRRLNAARDLLRSPRASRSVIEVALETGFNNPGYFSRSYKAAFGETPAETLRRTR